MAPRSARTIMASTCRPRPARLGSRVVARLPACVPLALASNPSLKFQILTKFILDCLQLQKPGSDKAVFNEDIGGKELCWLDRALPCRAALRWARKRSSPCLGSMAAGRKTRGQCLFLPPRVTPQSLFTAAASSASSQSKRTAAESLNSSTNAKNKSSLPYFFHLT